MLADSLSLMDVGVDDRMMVEAHTSIMKFVHDALWPRFKKDCGSSSLALVLCILPSPRGSSGFTSSAGAATSAPKNSMGRWHVTDLEGKADGRGG
ncbi:hypothetical protein ACOMHN_031290 [Nucella lapillus]